MFSLWVSLTERKWVTLASRRGKTYRGTYEPIITRKLWQRVQEVIQHRLALNRLTFDHEVLGWLKQALRQSHALPVEEVVVD